MSRFINTKVLLGILLALLVPCAGIIMTDAPSIWPVSTLIYNLGLVYSFALAPRSKARVIVYYIVATFFFVIETSFFFSYYIQNAGFNDAFFYHIRPDLIYAGVREYLPGLLVMIVCLVGFLVMSGSALSGERRRKAVWAPLALGLLAFGLYISPPAKAIINYTESISSVHKDDAVFENFRELLGPGVSVEFLQSKRPNIVLIYAESLEQRFFDETQFPRLLPNLKKLRKESIDFSNISQGVGAGWTIGGIVASQCAYPLAVPFEVDRNEYSMFDEFLPKATCLGDLLKKDGYRLTFIGGADARFAGKGNFLDAHGYQEVLGRDVLESSLTNKAYHNPWGVFDDTMFDFATRKFIDLGNNGSPFLLTLLTLDAHGYNGYLSKSCSVYEKGENSILNAIHCSDQLISRFIEQVRNSHYSDNTIIIVLNDHLAMRNKATPLLKSSRIPSRLTLLVNMPDNRSALNTNPGTHYDIAPTILELVGYKIHGQMGFGAPLTRGPGYLPGKFGADKWINQSANLMAIGGKLWNNGMTLDSGGIKFTAAALVLTMGGRQFNLSAGGFIDVPTSTLFVFDEKNLKLEKLKSFPLEQGLAPETLSRALLQHKEKLVLVIGRAGYLPGFSDPRENPDQWVFFCGRPGSDFFSWGHITGDFIIPFDLIQKLQAGKLDDRVMHEREAMVNAFEGNRSTKQ